MNAADTQRAAPSLEDVVQRLRALVAEQEGLDPQQVAPDSRLEQDLGMDSLSIVELQMAAEEVFGVTLPDDVPTPTIATAAEQILAAVRRANAGSG